MTLGPAGYAGGLFVSGFRSPGANLLLVRVDDRCIADRGSADHGACRTEEDTGRDSAITG